MANKVATAESAVDQAVKIVQSGKTMDFCQKMWENYHEEIFHFGKVILLAVIAVIIAWLCCKIARKVVYKLINIVPNIDESVSRVAYITVRTMIWLFATLIILELLGINTASILTVLGAAGLAIGLAMKDSLSNIAAGIMLVILRPYKLGDYIDCGSISGTIKEMGLFSTSLETVDGIFVAAPNSVIFGTPVKNYSRNPLRRADITVGIAYEDSLVKGIETLQKLMDENELIVKDPAPEVLVDNLADSSVNLTLRFWTKTADYWNAYWMVKGQLKGTIEGAGLNIPFPQRVVTFANAIPEEKK